MYINAITDIVYFKLPNDYLEYRFNYEYLISQIATPHILLVLIIAELEKKINYTHYPVNIQVTVAV